MNYDEAVTEARRLVKRSEEDQWRLAELTWEMVRGGISQRQWAIDIEVSEAHARFLVHIWDAYRVRTDRPAFADAYAAAKGLPEDRQERREMEAVKRLQSMPPERKAEIVQELLENPEVRELIPQPRRSSGFSDAYVQATREVDEERAAYMEMADIVSRLSGLHRYQPDDVFSHATPGDLRSWDHGFDVGLPFMNAVASSVKARLRGKLEVVGG